jgi:hypothetical protein
MSVLVQNITAEQGLEAVAVPTRPDGSYYRFEMICDSGWSRVYDDEARGLIAHLIPGYATLADEAARLVARTAHAEEIRAHLQAAVNTAYQDIPCTPAQTHALNAGTAELLGVQVWDSEVPLVLVDAFYFPHSRTPRPDGITEAGNPAHTVNIWWVTPAEGELGYLRSLHEIGLITLSVSRDQAI